jgi:hypothetical protein
MTELDGLSAADLFERGVSAMRLELAANGCPDPIIEQAVRGMRADYAHTQEWLLVVEEAARRCNAFGAFNPVKFASALRASR